MKRTPCEHMMWHGLPLIRKELAERLISDFGLSQRDAAEKLGITPAAVCQYISKKRGCIDINDDTILKEIMISAERILSEDDDVVIIEMCRICRVIQSRHMLFLADEIKDENK